MAKLVLVLCAVLVVGIVNVAAQRLVLPLSTYRPPADGKVPLIFPTYRPPVNRGPVIRTARQANDEPQWLWQGDNIERAPSTADHPVLPSVIDDVSLNPNRRYARSKDSPSAKSYGGGRSSSSSSSRDTGSTHPGYNRRNARSIRPPDFDIDPVRPHVPGLPSPFDPFGPRPHGPYPIYARTVRDVQFPGMKKPSHRDVIIPNWNPNVRTNPWDSLGGRRKTRSLGNPGKEDEIYHDYYDVIRQE